MPWLTPDFDENAGTICRKVTVPAFFIECLSGALHELTLTRNWQQFGNMTPGECATSMIDMLYAFYASEGCMIGTIVATAVQTLPANQLLCDGSTHDADDWPGLFAVLHDNLKIDANTFRVPDLRHRFILGDIAPAGDGVGEMGGAATHALTIEEMPEHNHEMRVHSGTADHQSPVGNVLSGEAAGATFVYSTETPDETANPDSIAPAGDGLAHNNMPPFFVLRYAIVAA